MADTQGDFIQIEWTSGSMDEARKICRYLVQERLVACAKIIPWIESVYMWNNQLETTQESKISLITRQEKYEEIKKVILQNSKYQVPEIIWKPIGGGSPEYLNWVAESTPSINR
jgi:periplasmic divalent cation tolerance protein